MERTRTLEQVTYRLADGIDETAFLVAISPTQSWLRSQPGFLGFELAVTPDGTWVDHVWWSDPTAAEVAAGAYMASDAAAALFAVLDMSSAVMRHYRIVRSSGEAGPAMTA